jgi:hypothetical protein
MTITLDKFGVPINGGKQGPILQPKRKYNFRVRFLNLGGIGNPGTSVTLNTQSVTLPSLSHDIQEVHAYNSRAYYAGKHAWSEIDLTVRDDVTNTVTRIIEAQLQRQLDHYNQTGFRSATDYKFTMLIEQMDGSDDAVLDTWTLEGCFISAANFGDGDYSTSDFRTISLTIRYDNATHTDEAGNRLMTDPGADPRGSNL